MPILKTLTINEFAIKDSFHFIKKSLINNLISLLVVPLTLVVPNIPLEKTIEMCTNERFTESETIEGLSKPEFK